MASQVVATMRRTKRPKNASQAAMSAAGRNPTSSATMMTRKQEKRFDAVDDRACPLRTDEGVTGMVRKRLMMPCWRSMLRRTAA
jgi:hypothetical protein